MEEYGEPNTSVAGEPTRPCRDPDCLGEAIQEQDGDHSYWDCQECGYCFGYEIVEMGEDTCAVGIPIETLQSMPQAPIPVQIGARK